MIQFYGGRIAFGSAIEHYADPRGRVEVYIEPRDLWIGAYVAGGTGPGAIYICPLPMLVIRISRARKAL